ncbi:ATPase [Peptostreptococcus russellii]|uniref:ATPase n=1 Tax=Peptostreptococcus russellii TaxID=215200 RepID=A0A2P7Q2F6_9FIRM|nr:ATP-binding protein [Peptostreptococcus russellii]PSJ32153.1 ATPase [Peptostreptococcus russellii]
MKELLILSGKGGTGKTTIAGAFIKLAQAQAFADCDVDAPNLHLSMELKDEAKVKDFYGMDKAYINQDKCISCGICKENCKFEAINYDGDKNKYTINPYGCEGCSVCQFLCPEDAISMEKDVAGQLILYDKEQIFSTAKLKMGSGNSGLLVSEVKKQIKSTDRSIEFAIIDGSPGIGCPVIASITGVDMILLVAEPTISGISDLMRIIDTANHFKVPMVLTINKYDINEDLSKKIEAICREKEIDFVGKIPYDKKAVEAVNKGLTIVDIDCQAGKSIKKVFDKTMALFFKNKENE